MDVKSSPESSPFDEFFLDDSSDDFWHDAADFSDVHLDPQTQGDDKESDIVALRSAVVNLSADGEKHSLEEVFTILTHVWKSKTAIPGLADSVVEAIPTRSTASPIDPRVRCFLVDKSAKRSASRKVPSSPSDASCPSTVSVKYQGFHNGEMWWSQKDDFMLGVVARRLFKASGCGDTMFAGKLFSLIQRQSSLQQEIYPKDIRHLVIAGAPSMVKFWEPATEKPRVKRPLKRPRTSYESASKAITPVKAESVETTNVKLVPRPEGGFYLLGDLHVVGSIHAEGSLHVDNGIRGQLITPPEAADYAEWFSALDPSESIQPGDVVQLRSPEQRVTLNTSGEGPLMIVSTKPSIAAGVPTDPEAAKLGVLCGFIGQVPVRVNGKVRVGDPLVASGNNDGCAVSAGKRLHPGFTSDPVGIAMEAFIPTHDEPRGIVLSMVRWENNVRWKLSQQLANAISMMWAGVNFLGPVMLVLEVVYLFVLRDKIAFFLNFLLFLGGLYALSLHYPYYYSYTKRDMYLFIFVGGLELLYTLTSSVVIVVRVGLENQESNVFEVTSWRENLRFLCALVTCMYWGVFIGRSMELYTTVQQFNGEVLASESQEQRSKSSKYKTL